MSSRVTCLDTYIANSMCDVAGSEELRPIFSITFEKADLRAIGLDQLNDPQFVLADQFRHRSQKGTTNKVAILKIPCDFGFLRLGRLWHRRTGIDLGGLLQLRHQPLQHGIGCEILLPEIFLSPEMLSHQYYVMTCHVTHVGLVIHDLT